jgi:NAD(P)-dependent dehydrogenase (short-subunit alcohol dehydrogenase family)
MSASPAQEGDVAETLDPGDPALLSVSGRVAIVTGASAGLGARFAKVLAAHGADVVVTARRLEKLQSLADEHPTIVPVSGDITSEEHRQQVVETALDRFGRVDILVNNAGGAGGIALEETVDEMRSHFELNLVAMYAMCQLTARPMIEAGRGSIVNLSSVLGLGGGYPLRLGSYTASKGAIVNLTRQLGTQWARHGVRVNAIAPGFFVTEGTEEALADERMASAVTRNTPMRRFGRGHELDGVLLFLASDASTFCTGQTLAIDGGWTAR